MASDEGRRYRDAVSPSGATTSLHVVKMSEEHPMDLGTPLTAEPSPFDFVDLAGSDREVGQRNIVGTRLDAARMTIELGRVRLPRERLASLEVGDVVSMEQDAQQPVSVLVNGTVVAYGHLVTVEGRIAVQVTERIDPSNAVGERRAA